MRLGPQVVVTGQNRIGKSNFVHALRLVLDPSLGDSRRTLRQEDFWDGLGETLTLDHRIKIRLDFAEIESDAAKAILGPFATQLNPLKARLTYVFAPRTDAQNPPKISDFEWRLFGGRQEFAPVSTYFRRRMPFEYVAAERNALGSMDTWTKNPFRPLFDEILDAVDAADSEAVEKSVFEAVSQLLDLPSVKRANESVSNHVEAALGPVHGGDPALGVVPRQFARLVRSLRLVFDEGRRTSTDASSGWGNAIYLLLKELQFSREHAQGNRDHTFLAVEEPECHLHPHLQRLIFDRLLRGREAMGGESSSSVILTTHSPYVTSVTPLDSIRFLAEDRNSGSTVGFDLEELELDESDIADLQRYLDVNRTEMAFARGVILVEGVSEKYVVPALLGAGTTGVELDREAISIVSIEGTHFWPYYAFLKALGKPVAVITDGDPGKSPSGVQRATALATRIAESPWSLEGNRRPGDESDLDLDAYGMFVGDVTFEVDLWKAGLAPQMCRVLGALAETGAAKERAEEWNKDPEAADMEAVMKDVQRIGKGRFGRRLASEVEGTTGPAYIKGAFDHVVEQLAQRIEDQT